MRTPDVIPVACMREVRFVQWEGTVARVRTVPVLDAEQLREGPTRQLVHALGAWLHVRDGSAASDRAHPEHGCRH